MPIIEQAAQALYDTQRAHEIDSDNPDAAEMLAQVWCRYLDRAGRPDLAAPVTPASRDVRVAPLMAVYETAHLGADEPASVISDIITDLLHYAVQHDIFGDGQDPMDSASELAQWALRNLRIERFGS